MPSVKQSALLAVWAACLWACLQVARLPGDWGHALCGPWGCGPPVQALLACHLAWVVLLAPIAVLFAGARSIRPRTKLVVSILAIAGGVLMLLGVVVHEWAVWRPSVDASVQAYIWQRCGFVVARGVDFPMIQLVLLGAGSLLVGRRVAA